MHIASRPSLVGRHGNPRAGGAAALASAALICAVAGVMPAHAWATPRLAKERSIVVAAADDSEVRPAPRRPRAEPLPGQGELPRLAPRPARPSPPRESDENGPIGCPDRHQKFELIV